MCGRRCVQLFHVTMKGSLTSTGLIKMNRNSTVRHGFRFVDEDGEQTPAEKAATQNVETNYARPEATPITQVVKEENENIKDLTEHPKSLVRPKRKRQKNPQDPSGGQPWSMTFDPILPSDKSYDDSDYAQIVDYRSCHALDIKQAKRKTDDEAVNELTHKLYRVCPLFTARKFYELTLMLYALSFHIKVFGYNVRRWVIQYGPKEKAHDELKATYDAQMNAWEREKIASEQLVADLTKKFEAFRLEKEKQLAEMQLKLEETTKKFEARLAFADYKFVHRLA